MSGFISRLAAISQGRLPLIKPVIAPAFSGSFSNASIEAEEELVPLSPRPFIAAPHAEPPVNRPFSQAPTPPPFHPVAPGDETISSPHAPSILSRSEQRHVADVASPPQSSAHQSSDLVANAVRVNADIGLLPSHSPALASTAPDSKAQLSAQASPSDQRRGPSSSRLTPSLVSSTAALPLRFEAPSSSEAASPASSHGLSHDSSFASPAVSPLLVREAEPEGAPVIRVSIGRVEVKAIMPPAAPARRSADRPKPSVTLDKFLEQRGRGTR